MVQTTFSDANCVDDEIVRVLKRRLMVSIWISDEEGEKKRRFGVECAIVAAVALWEIVESQNRYLTYACSFRNGTRDFL